MTDKEIIINGMDVSECEHYEDLNCFAYRDSCGYPLDCKDNPSCYYKQLKRKEQECEELKKIIQRHDNDNNALLKEVEDKLCEYYRRYRECLTDIEEIAEKDFNHTCWEIYARQLKQILQKISECKGDYNEKIR